jgi:c-di-GMP-binding flagellar brake protein YcgR
MFDLIKLKEDKNIKIYNKPIEINLLLNKFLNTKLPIIIYPVPDCNEYTTNILSIFDNYIIIDSLITGNLNLIKSDYIKFMFKFNNNQYFFISKLYNYKENDKYFNLYIYKPLEILYIENRKYFRVDTRMNNPKISFNFNSH